MKRDPHYQSILAQLDGQLDPDSFEHCAADVLRVEIPSLVPIRGGSDSGMDGAIADCEGEAYPLVTTTSEDVIGNLTRNLTTYVANGGARRKVVLATSRELTARRRRNLEERASKLGFTLVQIYDRAAIADRLYDNARWCRELLGLSGEPPALSVEPRSARPLMDIQPVGRDGDLAWLRETNGDRLLIGQPGSGKTFVFRRLVRDGWGLFVASDNFTRIAEDYRSKKPSVLIVDDAHVRRELLAELRRFQVETGAKFAIVASSWPGDASLVAGDLNLAAAQIRQLELLTRDEIISVVNAAGIRGSVDLIREIVNQSAGLPGLAITLADICLKGGVRELALGNALQQSVRISFEPLVGPSAIEFLAAFAVGGDAGMSLDSVSRALGVPIVDLRRAVTTLASGGVVFDAGDSRLAVRPKALRHALVRDVFFSGATSLPLQPLLDESTHVSDVALTLVGARGYGAEVPTDLLTRELERADSDVAWGWFASLGSEESRLVLERHPELAVPIAQPILNQAPYLVIPQLLRAAIGDERSLASHPEHPLRLIEDWVEDVQPGTGEAVQKRRTLLGSVMTWLSSGGDARVALRCLPLILSPQSKRKSTDPGSTLIVRLAWGPLPVQDLESLADLWEGCLGMIRSVGERDWSLVLNATRAWAYPLRPVGPAGQILPEIQQTLQRFAGRMVGDVVTVAEGRSGVLHALNQIADALGLDLKIELDPEFEIVFPPRVKGREWSEVYEEQCQTTSRLAEVWATRDPVTVLRQVERILAEASTAGLRGPNQLDVLLHALAQRIESPMAWVQAMLDVGTPELLASPILWRAALANDPRWPSLARAALDLPSWRGVIDYAVLMTPSPPADLLSTILDRVKDFPDVVLTVCLGRQVPERTLLRILEDGADEVAGAAAVGDWQANPPGQVREPLRDAWRSAIVRCPTGDNGIGEILKTDPEVARLWLVAHIDSIARINIDSDQTIAEALNALDVAGRRSLLGSLPDDLFDGRIIATLIDGDLDLYRWFLEISRPAYQHLAPLSGASMTSDFETTPKLDNTWAQKAILALDHGYSAEDVAQAAVGRSFSWCGNASEMWNAWVVQFQSMLTHPDHRVRLVAEIGRAGAARNRDDALRRERSAAVYGFD
jgi:hypothetical protein